MEQHTNPEKPGLIAGAMLIVVGALLLVVPSLAGVDMMDVGYALAFFGLFLLISGFVTLWIFLVRYRSVQRILSGQDLLARWSYDPEEGQRLARDAFDERVAGNRSLFWITAVLIVVIGFFVLVWPMIRGEDLIWQVVAAYFGLIPVLGLVAWLAPRLEYRQALREANEVFIARTGVYVRGALHTWKQIGSGLERVTYDRVSTPPVLVFELSHLSSVGGIHQEPEVLRVAVPEGREVDAERVEAYFAGRVSG